MELSYEETNLIEEEKRIDFIFILIKLKLTYHPILNRIHGNKCNDIAVSKHNMTMCMCKISISMLIREISFYLLLLNQANLQMAK